MPANALRPEWPRSGISATRLPDQAPSCDSTACKDHRTAGQALALPGNPIHCTNPCSFSQNKQSFAHGCGCANGGLSLSPKPCRAFW